MWPVGWDSVRMLSIDGSSLALRDIADVADGGLDVRVSSMTRAQAARAYAEQMASSRPIYGRTTGVGGNRLVALDNGPDAAFDSSLGLLRSHASSAGPTRSVRRVRAGLLVRLNQLAAGGSGVDPAVIDGLATMIRTDALPPVRELGGVGTGDLAALATTALALLGEVPTTHPLPGAVPFGIGDALPLLSSNAFTIADAALAGIALRDLAERALVIAAATFTAVDGNSEAFSSVVEQVTPFPGARRVCAVMRTLIDPAVPGARIQDPFALRALPQVHGPLLDALDTLDTVVVTLANSPSENPIFVPEESVAHHGGFHVAYLAQALDAVRLALAQACQLSLARLSMLCDPSMTGLAPFLARRAPGRVRRDDGGVRRRVRAGGAAGARDPGQRADRHAVARGRGGRQLRLARCPAGAGLGAGGAERARRRARGGRAVPAYARSRATGAAQLARRPGRPQRLVRRPRPDPGPDLRRALAQPAGLGVSDETLGSEDYFREALRVLGQHGPDGLTIAELCARLRVTKGSFYHHFAGMPAFIDALIVFWEADQQARLAAVPRAEGPAAERLETLVDAVLELPHGVEAALRGWGASRPDVAAAQARVDRRRERRAADTLVSLGVAREDARRLARLGMNALIGAQLRDEAYDWRRMRAVLDELARLVLRDVQRARAARRH